MLREATDSFTVPADACASYRSLYACASYRSLYERLDALDHDTRMHVFRENHTLFPAAIALQTGP